MDIDNKVEMIKSNKGGAKIIYNGYMYTIHKKIQNRIRWRCSQRTLHCKGSVTTGYGPPVINRPHNHIPDANALAKARSRSALLQNEVSQDFPVDIIPLYEAQLVSDNENDMEEDRSIESSPQKSLLKPQSKPISPPKPSLPIAIPPPKLSPPTAVPPPSPESEMCLRWNSHHVNMQTVFPMLMDDERYVDVTLAAEGKLLKCHKLILSSCSTYFDDMLKETNPMQQTIIFLRDIKFWQIKALVDFMYKGEVNVDQSKLEALLQAAEDLQIKGLAGKTSKKEPETTAPMIEPLPMVPSIVQRSPPYSDSEIKTEISNSTLEDDGDEDYFPHSEYKKGKYKKNRKRKVSNPPDPSLLKHVKINLKGTKSRPNIKQPKFFSPDYPEYNFDRCISPPKAESDPVFRIDNIKLEPIDIEVPQSPTFFEMSSMMDKSISESSSNKDSQISIEEKSIICDLNIHKHPLRDHEEKSKIAVDKQMIFESACKNIEIPSTSKEMLSEKSKTLETINLPKKVIGETTQKDVLNLNKNAIIVKRQNVQKFIEDTKIQKILDAATTKTLGDGDKPKLPQIRVRNLPTTETMLKKFATNQLTSILKKGDSSPSPNKHIILKKVTNKPAILRHSLPAKTKTFTTEIQKSDEIAEKISLLAKTKKELHLTEEKEETAVKEKTKHESSKKLETEDDDEEIIAD